MRTALPCCGGTGAVTKLNPCNTVPIGSPLIARTAHVPVAEASITVTAGPSVERTSMPLPKKSIASR